jgi:hypothetical protein
MKVIGKTCLLEVGKFIGFERLVLSVFNILSQVFELAGRRHKSPDPEIGASRCLDRERHPKSHALAPSTPSQLDVKKGDSHVSGAQHTRTTRDFLYLLLKCILESCLRA